MLEFLAERLRERDAQGLTRRLRVAGSPTAPRQTVDGEPRLLFCSNDYLGLASHPQIVAALQEGARRWGAGSGGSALISGYGEPQRRLEERLAAWAAPHIPGARAVGFGTGYMANLALVPTLVGRGDAVFADKLNGKQKPVAAEFTGLTVPDRFVFGYGMDAGGAWRNLPAIYAKKD